ncbi:hypothetical protein BN1326_60479 [Staphylococcus argenteus]|uniref:Uncharacterized protein n=1 Tax=Staphylococcus argenteus TaxID=985002 RepID=A0A7U7JUE4_9STAP|nr:hypothetical protein BN1326_60479 [Staphylococcus argenteus]CRI27327.1 hypothetical protein BN1326_60479 [Staphylococcus argenteus]
MLVFFMSIVILLCGNVFGVKFNHVNIVKYLCEVLVKYGISIDLKILMV